MIDKQEEENRVRPYVIQIFKNDRGEVDNAKLIVPGSGGERLFQITGTEATFSPEAGAVYACGELFALTLPDYPVNGSFVVTFLSGTVPTVLTVPQSLAMPEGFTVEANTRYEINVRDGYALCAGWEVIA